MSKPSDSMLLDRAKQGAVSWVTAALATPVISKAAQVTGLLIDAIKGRTATTRGGKVLRDVAGDKAAQFRSAWTNSPDNLTAAQAASGIDDPVMSALGARAAQNDSRYTNQVMNGQRQNMIDEMVKVAGGQTQTESKLLRNASRSALNNLTTPMRDTELSAANTAGRLLPKLQGQADDLGSAAANKVNDVRRFTAASDRAQNLANNTFPVSGQPRVAGKYTYMGNWRIKQTMWQRVPLRIR